MNSDKPFKQFDRNSVQSLKMKKGDRMIIDGTVELQIDEFKTDSSLDNVVQITFSMPKSNAVLKLGPGASMPRSTGFEQKKRIDH